MVAGERKFVEDKELVDLSTEIDGCYERVFANSDAFNRYFFATPDSNVREAQVRLGVVLERLMREPNERFQFLLGRFRDTEYPETSLHNIEGFRQGSFYVNQYLALNLEKWEKEQPTQMEKFVRDITQIICNAKHIALPSGLLDSKTIYGYPVIKLAPKDISDVTSLVFGSQSEQEVREYDSGRFNVRADNSKMRCEVAVNHHDVFGDYVRLSIYDSDWIKIDDGIKEEYKKYTEQEIRPSQLESAAVALVPKSIIYAISEGKKKSEVLERLNWLPDLPTEENRYDPTIYSVRGRCDLSPDSARRLGYISERYYQYDFVEVSGRFATPQEFYNMLFAIEPPVRNVFDTAATTTAVVPLGNRVTPTHQRVIDYLGSRENGNRLDKFIESSEAILRGYRYFNPTDADMFTIPEGYIPVAVENSSQYALAYKHVDKGVEICVQLPNKDIAAQFDVRIVEGENSIRAMEAKNEKLRQRRERYQNLFGGDGGN